MDSPVADHPVVGALLCLISAAGFGAMAIFGKLAFEEGVTVLTLLTTRFVLAAICLAPLALVRMRRRGRIPRRGLMAAVLLGAVGYALQAGLFFAALERMDASLLALLLYTYPAMVTVVAIALGRERPDRRRLGALLLASAGLVLILGGAAQGALDPAAVVMALAAAATYTAYILISDRTVAELDPLALSALVTAGAATTFAVLSLGSDLLGVTVSFTGRLDLTLSAEAWLWLGCIAVVSTALAVVCFFAGMARVGPSAAAILSTFEPPVTVALAFVAFGETLGGSQLAGALLILVAVMALQVSARERAPAAAAVPT